ncbi:MAG: hypothetical protein E6772_07520 [Dysgonomonas sp.]|nr:hypothetical protein [Dysgonomonas sp.]
MLSIVLFWHLGQGVYARETIGSGIKPNKGSLLDLKENDQTGNKANATKGVGLPCVALSTPATLTVDAGTEGSKYAGLLVYNVTANTELEEGIYYWVG